MYVNNNSAALNSWLNLNNTTSTMENTLAQLSSGYKINSAGDNPAGLAIAQNMQAQANALSQGSQNAQSGVSLLQTADGGLNQIQNILQSMYQLASQAASGTMNSTDTSAIQSEMNQYAKEITQITNTTTFNGLNLLSGALNNTQVQFGPNGSISGTSNNLTIGIAASDSYSLGIEGKNGTLATGGAATATAPATAADVNLSTAASNVIAGNNLSAGTYSVGSTYNGWSTGSFSKSADVTGAKISGTYASNATNKYAISLHTSSGKKVTSGSYTVNGGTAQTINFASTASTAAKFSFAGVTLQSSLTATASATDTIHLSLKPMTTTFKFYNNANATAPAVASKVMTGPQSKATLTLVNGSNTYFTDNSVTTTAASVAAPTAVAASTVFGGKLVNGYDTFAVTNAGRTATGSNGALSTSASLSKALDITNQSNAQSAMTIINNAINTVSATRGTVGAYMNRLQFAYNTNQVTSQNLTNARAGIMDTDMAMAMATLSQQQVLQQSGVAMLSQATALPQALLRLLT